MLLEPAHLRPWRYCSLVENHAISDQNIAIIERDMGSEDAWPSWQSKWQIHAMPHTCYENDSWYFPQPDEICGANARIW